ncbi:predicted protein [Sclerotinia sclerotiorum 1980 UF-70]|uniref:Uncharacterized protein n=1 Tax=Sclerotinia sclerotiorum (strain ATCC 18683 / 1980 / Ss-1) TaxID=665079 RepID=A7F4Y5_SCLS1|nr:predicted protein [Sclerotinia sclerotiorum 1980 UF-70]EDN97806.1 predicted protein [Sclerotinia sclerotiorum 1980 UF-70]
MPFSFIVIFIGLNISIQFSQISVCNPFYALTKSTRVARKLIAPKGDSVEIILRYRVYRVTSGTCTAYRYLSTWSSKIVRQEQEQKCASILTKLEYPIAEWPIAQAGTKGVIKDHCRKSF